MWFKSFAIATIVGVVISLLFRGHDPITGKRLLIWRSDSPIEYDIKPATAPVATGKFLDVLSFLFTKTRFGPSIMRQLLNDNGIVNLRELASQITLPPMYFPMRRLNKAELQKYKSEMDPGFTVDSIVQNGLGNQDGILLSSSLNHTLRSIEDYSREYLSGKILPSTLLKRTVSTIKDWEKQGFRIFSTVIEESVMKQAKESDERYRQGKPLSVLDGIPVAFKDSLDVQGHAAYAGQNPGKEFQDFVRHPTKDDIMVRQFRALGAIILGSTIMIEGGVTPVGYSMHFQGPVSVFSWNRYPGGSSSGSAVAVMTGLVPLAIGFDGGGSVRLPGALFYMLSFFSWLPF
jgi:hypothetical protein